MDPTKSKTTDATLGGVPPVSQVSSEPTSDIGTGVSSANEPSMTPTLGGVSTTPPEPITEDPVTSAPPAPPVPAPVSTGSASAGTGMGMVTPEPNLTEPATPPAEPTMPVGSMPTSGADEQEETPGSGSPSGLGGTL